MDINEKKLGILGLRGGFGPILAAHINELMDWRVVTADTSTSAGLARLRSSQPDKFIECGIAEQAAMGVATGIALEGIPTFIGSFSPFIVGRAWEQVRLAAYMNAEMTIFGFGAGLGLSYLGYTHCSLEDVSLIASIPNTVIFEPSTPREILRALSTKVPNQVKYIRLTGDGPIHKDWLSDEVIKFDGLLFLGAKDNGIRTIITAGYTASRLSRLEEVRSIANIISINRLSEEEISSIPKAWLEGEIVVVHESYDNILLNLVKSVIGGAYVGGIRSLGPVKGFTKPGDFEFCSKALGYDLDSLGRI